VTRRAAGASEGPEPELDAAKLQFNADLEQLRSAFRTLSAERRPNWHQRQLDSDDRGLVRELGAQVALLHTLVLDDRLHLL
jgi:hypothetical protein